MDATEIASQLVNSNICALVDTYTTEDATIPDILRAMIANIEIALADIEDDLVD